MKKILTKIFIVGILLFSSLGCIRPEKDTTRVSMQLPTYNNVSSLACTKCLMYVFVNVIGDFPVLKFSQKVDAVDGSATALNGEIVLDVPSGPGRVIKVLAVYRLTSNGTLEAQYGEVKTDIFGIEPPPIVINLVNKGQFKGGSVAGRYLTDLDFGPTDRIIVSFDDPGSGINMEMFDAPMFNGWFEAFMSDSHKMTYRRGSDFSILGGFANVKLSDITPTSTDVTKSRFFRPSDYWVFNGSAWDHIIESNDIVYGFFGGTSFTAGKKVCIDDASDPASLSKVSSNGSTADYTFSPATNSINRIYGQGGALFSSAGVCDGSGTQYLSSRINIRPEQFNGKGNDTARSLKGAFSYFKNSDGSIRPYEKSGMTFTFHSLAGLVEVPIAAESTVLFDGIKLFSRPTPAINTKIERPPCDKIWLDSNGFVEFDPIWFSSAPNVPNADVISFSLTTPGYSDLQSRQTIVCPVKKGALKGLGGIFIDKLN